MRHAVDLFFRGEFFADDSWRWFDWLREVSSLSERSVFHVWSEVGAGAFAASLSLGLVCVFVRCRAFTLFIFVETMSQWPNKSPEPTAVGAVSSAVAVHVASRRWLSFFR